VAFAAVIPLAIALYLSLAFMEKSWDDGAITAAFSRTWVDTGKIALTPLSPVVEGFSSIAWFVLLGVPRLFTQRPDAIVIWMKCLAAVAAVLLLWVFFRIARAQFRSADTAVGAVLVLAFSMPVFHEIQNGMEMNLAALLLVVMFYLLTSDGINRGRLVWAWAAGSLLLVTRFEAPYAMVFLFVGLWLDVEQERRVSRRELAVLAGALMLSFGATELWRHQVFGVWMPNTVYAKRWMPYRDVSSVRAMLETRVLATEEIGRVYPALLFAAVVLVGRRLLRRGHNEGAERVSRAVWTVAMGAALFGLLFGANLGYPGRMTSTMLPFLVLALIAVCLGAVKVENKIRVLWMLVGLQALTWVATAAVTKGYRTITIGRMERKGRGADEIRQALHKDSLVVMLPDVGGSSLCCERLQIVDSALLTDPYLAQHGWAAFEDYFRSIRPEVVETHDVWAELQHLYTSDLLKDYGIVGDEGGRFFVRGDLFQQLMDAGTGEVVPVESSALCLNGIPEEGTGADIAFSHSKGICLVLKPPTQ
jgi:hypothetical protein